MIHSLYPHTYFLPEINKHNQIGVSKNPIFPMSTQVARIYGIFGNSGLGAGGGGGVEGVA